MSYLPSRIGPDSGPPTGLVVKVKYESTLRRFNVYISEDGRPDISLNALRYKICDLFNFNLNSDFIITYIDEDNDIINMVDEDELLDAVGQRLNPLRLEVSFKGEGAAMRSSSETSTLKTNAIPKGNDQTFNSASICLDRIFKDFSEMVQKTQITSTNNPRLKNVASVPEMAEISDSFTKHVTTTSSLTEGCRGLEPCSDTRANNDRTHTMYEQENDNDCKFPTGHHNLSGPSSPPLSIETRYNHNCHHDLENLSGPSASCPVSRDISSNGSRRTTRPSKITLRIFHKGVQCDGCGMNPIVGPRYVSKIKDNYDLCLSCFCEMGKDDEYTKIAHPLENTLPKSPKGVQCHGSGMSPIVCPFCSKIKDDRDLCCGCFCKMGNEDGYRRVGSVEVADCLKTAHPCDSYWSQRIYKEGVAHQGKLFDTSSSVGKMDNQSPGKLNCCFVKDVTVFDGAQLPPGTHFTKIWRLRNNGTLPWPQHTQLVRFAGIDLGAGNEVKLEIQEQGCPVDEDFDAVVHFIAPMHPGRYISHWRLMTPSGQKFGQQVWVHIQVVESSKEGFLSLPVKSVQTTKDTEKSKPRLFGVDISLDECVSPHPMKSVQTTKDTDGNAVSFQRQSKQKLFSVDISLKESDEKAILSDDNMNLKFSDVVRIRDGASMIEQSGEKASGVTVQDFYVPVTLPDSASMIEQAGEKASGLTVQNSDVPIQHATFMPSTVRGNPLFFAPVHNASKGNFDVPVRAPSLVMSDTNSDSGKYPADIKQMEQFCRDDLEAMDFNQRKLNPDVLRKNKQDLQNTSDGLCTAAGWDSLVEELQEMGFYDLEKNKRSLLKNDHRVKRVFLNLSSAESAASLEDVD